MSVLPNFSVLIVAQPQKLPNSKVSSDICLSYDTFEEMSQRGPRDGWRARESLQKCDWAAKPLNHMVYHWGFDQIC